MEIFMKILITSVFAIFLILIVVFQPNNLDRQQEEIISSTQNFYIPK